jgi:hypothetical protein
MKINQMRRVVCELISLLTTVSFLNAPVVAQPNQGDTPEEQPPLELNATLNTRVTKPQYENLTRSMNEEQQRFQAKYLEKRKNCGAAPDPFASLPPSNRTSSLGNGTVGGGGIDPIAFAGLLIKGELFKPRNCDL